MSSSGRGPPDVPSLEKAGAATAVLVSRAQLGDLHALDTVLASIQAPLFRHICTVLGDGDAAEDVLQETLLAISRKIGVLREPKWFRAWAFRIATREAVRQARRARRQPQGIDADDLAAFPTEEPDVRFDPELLAALPGALDELSPASRLVLRMHYLEELSYVEVAEALEISIGTVKSRLAYGLAALRKLVRTSE